MRSIHKMDTIAQLKHIVGNLLSSQKLAVLSTFGNEQPYASLIAFAATDDLKHIIFATTRATRKYANLFSESKAALLIDNRTNKEKDFSYAVAATALGRAEEAKELQRKSFEEIYIRKHPYLEEFVSSPSSALLVVRVEKYYVVSRFQNVQELHML